ncbi:Ubiquitin-conjugating enzyme E2 6 [Hypsizygus marmoreus]|uniref:Ubiquitin-conjugating enzyme E2 6 n=1 Tax=Hypsizygus marmoreus TaxID=39966 RepID=A0A369JU57_HYPMA|nr:Ubiquitin-conjugating enzyme E2 6 [Hypsizygus marmoreus]
MASKAAQKRLTKEYVAMQKEPPPFVWAVPDEKNILTWNFLIRGPPDTPFAGGEYHGILLFPSEYPFKPPGIKMLTPSGRFQPDRKICFSMSDFHPGTWNPAWSVATILTGLLSFMLSDEMTTGSVTSAEAHKRAFATRSHAWNLTQPRFRDAFPEYCTPHLRDLPNMGHKERGKPEPLLPSSISSTPTPSFRLTPSTSSVSLPPNPGPLNLVPTTNAANLGTGKHDDNHKPAAGLAATWGRILWEKWRWGVLIAFAVIVSRFSSSN